MRSAIDLQVNLERSKSSLAWRTPLVSRLYKPGSALWMIRAGSDITALVALWITLLMMFWNPLVSPLSWFWIVVLMLMADQVAVPAISRPRSSACRSALMETVPPPIEYMTVTDHAAAGLEAAALSPCPATGGKRADVLTLLQ